LKTGNANGKGIENLIDSENKEKIFEVKGNDVV
jgi:hypothetical protein